MNKTCNQEHIIGIICIAIGAVVLALTRSFPGGTSAASISGPAFFPNTLSWLLIGLGAVELVKGFFGTLEHIATAADIWKSIKTPQFLNLVIMTILFICFIAAMEHAGFILTTAVFLLVVHWRLGIKLIRNLIYTAVFVGIIYLVFNVVFRVSLPSGSLW